MKTAPRTCSGRGVPGASGAPAAIAALAACALLFSCSPGERGGITGSGTIEATDVDIGAEVSGKVAEVRVEEGSTVKRGDTLVVVDGAEYRIQLRQAAANAAALEAAWRLALAGSRAEDIVQAEAAYKAAEADYERSKGLLASNSASRKQLDDATARFVAAEQNLRKLERGQRPEEIRGARLRFENASAQADLFRKRLADCAILAPSRGTITLRAVEPGELVAPGTHVLRLTDLSRVRLTIYVGERDLAQISLGQHASVTIDGDPGRSFDGTVSYISPVAEFTPKNVQTKEERTKLVFGVRLSIPNSDGTLKPGLPADAAVTPAPR